VKIAQFRLIHDKAVHPLIREVVEPDAIGVPLTLRAPRCGEVARRPPFDGLGKNPRHLFVLLGRHLLLKSPVRVDLITFKELVRIISLEGFRYVKGPVLNVLPGVVAKVARLGP